jgi:peptidoglycan/xylan/chitin deacetylase (PgdA/CDA1 family)
MNVFIMQNSIVRPLGRDMQNVLIGFVGEHEARTFFVRTRDDLTGYTISLVIGDVDCGAMTKAPMPDGSTMLSLTLTSDMLGNGGDKVCQLLMVKDTIVRKSSQFRAYVGASNDINSTAPDSATIIIISEKITELVHEAALDAIEEVQEVIDSIPADYSTLSAQVDTNTEDIGGLKADLGVLQDVTIVKDSAINIGSLVSGSTINASNGQNVSAAYGTRTGYVDFSAPVLLQFDFDLSVYQYDVFTYTRHDVSTVADNPTNGVFADDERITVLVPSGSAPCFRIGIMRKDRQEMTTDATDPASDFYKIKHGISIYRYTDTTLSKEGIPADALAVKQALGKSFMLDVSYRQNILGGSDLNDYLTTGNYWSTAAANVSNSPTTNNFIMFAFPTINSGRVIQIVQESSLASKTFIRYYNGTVWTAWKQFLSSADIDIDVLNASSDNIMPVYPDGTTTQNGITVVSDGTGTYKISGTATEGTVYNIYQNTSAFPRDIKPGLTYHVMFDNPSLYTQLRMSYYKDDVWVSVLSGGEYDTVFTIPEDATGFRIRLYFYANGLNSPEFEVHPQMYVLNSPGDILSNMRPAYYPPMLTIIDDDGYGYFYRDIKPLCEAKNVSISSAVITARMGQSEGYMTWEQVQECYAAGCEILSHGYNHKTDAEILTDGTTAEELEKWYRMAKHDLQLHGIKSEIFVFNNNTANVIQCQQAARRVYQGAIHAAGGKINTPASDPYYIKRFNFTAGSHEEPHTLQEMTDNIDALVAAGTGWDVWMIHTSSTGGWSADEVTKLGAAIDYARAHGVLVTTVEHAMRIYYGKQIPNRKGDST